MAHDHLVPPLSAYDLPEMLDFLLRRRSSKIKNISAPGPDAAQLARILSAAARVPDHGKLVPWRFIVINGEARQRAGEFLRAAYLQEDPAAAPAKLDLEEQRFFRAPVVIAVVSSLKDGKTPEWEQILSAGAACFNCCLAANAQGFATTWLSEWYAYNAAFKKAMGLGTQERFAGFIYIGSASDAPEERERPNMDDVITYL